MICLLLEAGRVAGLFFIGGQNGLNELEDLERDPNDGGLL